MVSTSPASAVLAVTVNEIKELLKMEEVLGLGESYWQNAILTPDNRILELMQETIKAGKTVMGHAAGAADKRLAAYGASGALSCHESVSPEDILNRLEMGFWAILRQGYIREDVGSIRSLIGKIDFRRCILCTDGTEPEYLLKHGYFNNVIQGAIDIGVPPADAIRMSSLNPAQLFRIDHLVGGVSPGRYADIIILPEPGIIKPDIVISNGNVIAENGIIKADLAHIPYNKKILKTVKIPLTKPKDFAVAALECSKPGYVRTMDIQNNGLVVKEGSAEAPIVNGKVVADPEKDLLKVVFIDRATGKAEMFVGFVRGWGMKAGAAATSHAWDASAIIAVGANDDDLALAINKVIVHQGASTLAAGGEILIDIPYPIAGYVSDAPIEEIASEMAGFQKKIEELGSKLRSAHLTLVTLRQQQYRLSGSRKKAISVFARTTMLGSKY